MTTNHVKVRALWVATLGDLMTALGLAVQVDDVEWPAPPWVNAR
jgi:hypothetical protein